jgi:hypothetical protein
MSEEEKKYTQADLDFFSDNADEYFEMANRYGARIIELEEIIERWRERYAEIASRHDLRLLETLCDGFYAATDTRQ